MPKVQWNQDQIIAAANKAVMDGAEEWARVDVLPAADENCPTDTGTMKGTHAVLRADNQVEIGYGGPAAPLHRQAARGPHPQPSIGKGEMAGGSVQ